MSEEVKDVDTHFAQLRVSHPKEGSYMGRGLILSLDGAELTTLKAGEAITTKIETGHHRLDVDNTYHSKTVEFDAQSGEQVHYRIRNKVGFFGSWMIMVLGAGPMNLSIERANPVESSTPLPSSTS